MADQHWYVETKDAFEGVHAERARIEGGALILTDGDLLSGEDVVMIYAPGHWWRAFPSECPDEDEE